LFKHWQLRIRTYFQRGGASLARESSSRACCGRKPAATFGYGLIFIRAQGHTAIARLLSRRSMSLREARFHRLAKRSDIEVGTHESAQA